MHYYIYEAAKLDNSEKNLTFAAQLMLENLRDEHDQANEAGKQNRQLSYLKRQLS